MRVASTRRAGIFHFSRFPRHSARCLAARIASARWTCASWAHRPRGLDKTRGPPPFVMTIAIAGNGAVRSERLGN